MEQDLSVLRPLSSVLWTVLLFNKTEEVKNVSMCDDIEAGFLIASKMRFGSSRAGLQQTL